MKYFVSFVLILISISNVRSQETEIVYLSGMGSDDAVEWDFYCTKGRKSGYWTKIPVPSNWELHGFGSYNYGHEKNKADEEGLYKHTFFVPPAWKNKQVKIVFVASMTDTEVKINGKLTGPVHQGGFYQFEYDISKKLQYGKENLLEVKVSKMSGNNSVNMAERQADYWVFGGIFRPVYLKISPGENIDRVAMDARADGSFYAEVYSSPLLKADNIKFWISDSNGNEFESAVVYKIEKDQSKIEIKKKFNKPEMWNPEFPNLYTAHFDLCEENKIIHRHSEKFGFRTVEVRIKDGIYVNGAKIMFRGVCRHSFWPESGRALNRSLSIKDVELMKNMNMNAVRMSHYPPDPHFLDICDSLGLFVLNELAGWQSPAYDTEIGRKLVYELVSRDVNHPCVVIWDNGNEGGWNIELDNEYKKYDPQNRPVIHPWELFGGMNTKHYIDWNYGTSTFFQGRDIFFPTEFLHGLYDGGSGAGLEDYWNLMLDNPLSAGGFLWVFSDEGVVRTDKGGEIDTYKNNAPDGILGPYREKEGSYYSIKEIWSPVHIPNDFIPPHFNGKILIENRYSFTNLGDCRFKASWIRDIGSEQTDTIITSIVLTENISPGNKGFLNVEFPIKNKTVSNYNGFQILCLSAYDPYGKEIMTWQWPLLEPEEFRREMTSEISLSAARGEETSNQIIMISNNTKVFISKQNGIIDSITYNSKSQGINEGPVLTTMTQDFSSINYTQRGSTFLVESTFSNEMGVINYELSPNGWLRIECNPKIKDELEFFGISFNLPESSNIAVKLLADGPYRVWKNRMKGPQFGLWHKLYNNTITGESWEYPEFKGYYSNFYMAEINSDEINFTCCTDTEDLFIRLFTPEGPHGSFNTNTSPSFPKGDISFLTAISPIGTKFKKAENMGPMGSFTKINTRQSDQAKPIILYFNFEKENKKN